MGDADMRNTIEKTVLDVLRESDINTISLFQVRNLASQILGIDLSGPSERQFIKEISKSFVEGKYHNRSDGIICKLSKLRKVAVSQFHGKTLVSIREYYSKDGKEHPGPKGISLTVEQWTLLKNNIAAIDKAAEEMESRLP